MEISLNKHFFPCKTLIASTTSTALPIPSPIVCTVFVITITHSTLFCLKMYFKILAKAQGD